MPGAQTHAVSSTAAQRPTGRSFLIDTFKAVGCLLIVLHHMAFYGPMSDVVARAWPALVSWLYDHGRLAVQLFLVCAGFLTAGSLSRLESLALPEALKLVLQRYLRLAIPLLAAFSFTVCVTEWVRPEFQHASLSAPPAWGQALAHLALLQHVLDMEALSAGIWYVAIDFQLYAMTLLSVVALKFWPLTWGTPSVHALRRAVWLGLTCASWWWWNLHTDLDDHGIYFFGSYGLGLLAWEARQSLHRPWPETDSQPPAHTQRRVIWVIFLAMGVVAWVMGPRLRMGLAFAVSAVLMAVPAAILSGQALQELSARRPGLAWLGRAVVWLSTVSYSVFLIHFGVSLAVSAGVTALWPGVLWANALGMLASLTLSLLMGAGLYYGVERHAPTWGRWWVWTGLFIASVALAKP
ncbi:acyltransferase [Limnohabitans sp. WS1]|uniref:acyltransferase family protein n=1 Tax=Limnohabitans sp. WS1 TaxID=1100726 RepID=UPI000D3BE582|nr:acyltransferase [Limnohabitans sp. WS1]PUE13499.1 hypothetical protein B9Z48_15020 [Limnohabitans sp. WS1]